MTPANVDKIAQGRVWVGDKALELGLVDQLGALDEAIVAAAGLAQLETWEVKQLTSPVSARELLISQLTGSGVLLQDLVRTVVPALGGEATDHPLLRQLQGAWDLLNTLNDPGHSYALCEPCSLSGLSWLR